MLTRRTALAGLAAPAVLGLAAKARAATRTFRISHHYPGSTGDEGDFRDRMCRRFAASVEKRTEGAMRFEVYPGSSLMKTFAQFDALRKGALDFGLVPTTYAGGQIPEMNLTFMPAIVTNYDQAYRWKTAPIGQEITRLLESKGVKIITWMWESGGIAARDKRILKPSDVSGLKVRGGSREMDIMFKAAGAGAISMPSNEIYLALQTGAVTACATSSTSLMSFRLNELSKYLLAPGSSSFFFILEPILMSKDIFDGLPKEQQDAVLAAGEELETFGRKTSEEDDKLLVETFRKSGLTVDTMDEAMIQPWHDVARDSAWKDFAARSSETARFLKLAEQA
ncbi:TRAP-type C4-dicarboxylate transport system substrate-binding protein [Methylobacterium aerolatum]|uniref:TRAP-type C4-dicarboxylate transport system substrate-binding protein n=2 Tax=Methylobacterium aerolatum TaxID=418708 RepID=A0ABU0I4W6_9HYPH|nr:TRAP-type C4-dicarboxylate transport system substrate-binding protein [Methylobacterium aerolatum]GJD36049.1 Solute-binding protein [Methylobacterium aerolatum]